MSSRASGRMRVLISRAASSSPSTTWRCSATHSSGATFATPEIQPVAPAAKPSSGQSSPPTSTSRSESRQRGDPPRVARALLDRDDGVDLAREPQQEARQQVGPAAGDGVVVDHDRQVGGRRHGGEEGEHLALVAAVEQRRQQHHGARAGRGGVARVGDRGLGVLGGDAGGHGRAAARRVDQRLDDGAALGRRQAAGLAHRAVADQAGQPGVEQRAGVASRARRGRPPRGRRTGW